MLVRRMPDYNQLFDENWRGWYNCGHVSEEDRAMIRESKARSYNGLLQESISIKKGELKTSQLRGNSMPFYEPSTFYGDFRPAHYHNNAEWAANRHATNIFSTFSRFRAHKCQDARVVPEERDGYDLSLWRISHPTPLKAGETALWKTINEVSETNPWAWPMAIGLPYDFYREEKIAETIPVFSTIQEKFMELDYTREDFFDAHKPLWHMLEWDRAKSM